MTTPTQAPKPKDRDKINDASGRPPNVEQAKAEDILSKVNKIDADKFSTLKVSTASPKHSGLLLAYDHLLTEEARRLLNSYEMGDPRLSQGTERKDRFGRRLDDDGPIPLWPREYSPQTVPNAPTGVTSTVADALSNGWLFVTRADNPEFIDEAFSEVTGRVHLAAGECVLMWRNRNVGKQIRYRDHARSRAMAESIKRQADPDFEKTARGIAAEAGFGEKDITINEDSASLSKV